MAFIILPSLSACSSLLAPAPPPQIEPLRFELSIKANNGLNPDRTGRPSPILLRVYELRSEAVFQEADFFSIQNADKTTLTGDLLAVDQFVLRPGEVRSLKRKSHPEATAIGIFAGYRDLPRATWRAVHKLPPASEVSWYSGMVPSSKVRLVIDLQPKAILVIDQDVRNDPSPPGSSTPDRRSAQCVPGPGVDIEDCVQLPAQNQSSTGLTGFEVPDLRPETYPNIYEGGVLPPDAVLDQGTNVVPHDAYPNVSPQNPPASDPDFVGASDGRGAADYPLYSNTHPNTNPGSANPAGYSDTYPTYSRTDPMSPASPSPQASSPAGGASSQSSASASGGAQPQAGGSMMQTIQDAILMESLEKVFPSTSSSR